MTNADELTPEVQKELGTIQKIFNLAAKNENENEAASATAKATERLAKLNMDITTFERGLIYLTPLARYERTTFR